MGRTPPTRASCEGGAVPIHQVKIVLDGVEPPIWRRLQVPGIASLGWLHAVFQVAMGWTNSHLHQFIAGRQVYSDPAFDLDEFEDSPRVRDEHTTRLVDIAPRVRSAFRYEYDFGDNWVHRVTVESLLSGDPSAAPAAVCLDGARACPPEDCGGIGGYAALLETIMDPTHEEYDSMLEWLGGDFEPEAFDRAHVNAHLQLLQWPHTTERRLGSVLLRRDGISE